MMKKLIVALMLLSFVLAGTALAATDNLPKSLKGVDLKAAKQVTDKEAKEVKGSGICPDPLYIHSYDYGTGLNQYPKDHKYLGTK